MNLNAIITAIPGLLNNGINRKADLLPQLRCYEGDFARAMTYLIRDKIVTRNGTKRNASYELTVPYHKAMEYVNGNFCTLALTNTTVESVIEPTVEPTVESVPAVEAEVLPKSKHATRLSKETKLAIVEQYRNDPYCTANTLAEQFGVTQPTISRILRSMLSTDEYRAAIAQRLSYRKNKATGKYDINPKATATLPSLPLLPSDDSTGYGNKGNNGQYRNGYGKTEYRTGQTRKEDNRYHGEQSPYHKPFVLKWKIEGNEYDIRVQWDDATWEWWFCAKDVCNALALDDVSAACRGLDNDEVIRLKICIALENQYSTYERDEEMLHVNESGLYHLVFKSQTAEAQAFKRWIRKEVLPSIREKGYYIDPNLPFARPRLPHHFNYRLLGDYIDKRRTIYLQPLYDLFYAIDNKTRDYTKRNHPPYFAWYTINWVIRPLWGNSEGDHYIEVCKLRDEHNRHGYDGHKILTLHQLLNEHGRTWLAHWLNETLPYYMHRAIASSSDPAIRKQNLASFLREWCGQQNLFDYAGDILRQSHATKTALTEHYEQLDKVYKKLSVHAIGTAD